MRLILLLLSFVSILCAHKLSIFSNYEDGLLYIESYFANGSPCQNCKVSITDSTKKELFSGVLDEKGVLQKEIVLYGETSISVHATEGHTATKTLNMASKEAVVKELHDNDAKSNIDSEEIAKIVSREMDKKLNPLLAKLDKKDEMSIEKIVSAIGYIFGIFGLMMFFKCRKYGKS